MAESTSDYVADMYRSYSETAEQVMEAVDNDEEYEEQDARDWLNEWALSLDTSIVVDVMLGVGGPTAYIHCECSKARFGLEIDRASFIAVWGSERRETRLDSSDALWRVAESYIEGMDLETLSGTGY
jgi:hypothetical protein